MVAPIISISAIPTSKLASIPEKELIAIYLAGVEQAHASLENADDALEVVHHGFLRLSDDRPWDPQKGSLRAWFLLIIKNECLKLRASRGPERHARNVRRAERFYRESCDRVASPEEQMIAMEDAEEDEAAAPARRALCRRIFSRISHNPDAVALVQHWATSDERLSLKQIAERLCIPGDRIYAAKKVIERAAKGEKS